MNDEQIIEKFEPIFGHASDIVNEFKINDDDGNVICFAGI
jgi:hypothetical protein